MLELATSLVLFTFARMRPGHDLLEAIHDFYEKELFGVVAYYESTEMRGPAVGGLLATVENNMAKVDRWWRDPNFEGPDVLAPLFTAFCERVPPWMMGVEITVDASNVLACKSMGRLGLKAVGTVKDREKYGDGEGIVFQKHFLSNFGR
jgi:hypothetical protein